MVDDVPVASQYCSPPVKVKDIDNSQEPPDLLVFAIGRTVTFHQAL
jgi:hypothetical protein